MFVFNLKDFGGLTINVMSLGGLSLGVGMLVDNAIVVMENIFRHRAMGKPAMLAATEGAEEVSNAIVASTLTTIAVFLPMIFGMQLVHFSKAFLICFLQRMLKKEILQIQRILRFIQMWVEMCVLKEFFIFDSFRSQIMPCYFLVAFSIIILL